MAKIKLFKDGDSIYVDADAVAAHQLMGWKTAPVALFEEGALLIDGEEVQVAGDAINVLSLPPCDDVENLVVRHYQAAPALQTATYVHAAANLGAAAQDVSTVITNPDVPRNVTVKGNVSGISGSVIITGTNIIDEVISETIALNGATEAPGSTAFKSVSNIHLPAQTHTPTKQVETATVAGTITLSGNATVIVTAAGMSGTPKTINVAVLDEDTAAEVAEKIRTALGEDAAVSALFTVSGADEAVVLTKKTYAANDSSLNISIDNGTCTGLTTAATSANTTAGVGYDTVSVGVGTKIGIPHIVDYASLMILALFGGSADTGGSLAVDADEVEKNLYTPAGTLDGTTLLDLYYLA
jgi:hypothetical protein